MPARRRDRAVPLPRWVRFALPALTGVLVGNCADSPTGPGRGGAGYLAVQPVFEQAVDLAAFSLAVDSVRVVIVRPPSQVVLDTTIFFPADADSVQAALRVPLLAPVEQFDVTLELRGGGQALFSGTQQVEIQSGPPDPTQPPTAIVVSYVGPGTNVASLLVEPLDSVITFGDSLRLRVSAFDAQQQPVPQFYVAWSVTSPEPSITAFGVLQAPGARGQTYVKARTPTDVIDSVRVTFVPVPATVAADSGGGQSLPIGAAARIVARVLGGDGLPIKGIPVQFSVASGGGQVADALVVSDSTGRAGTQATLSLTAGPQVFEARVTSVAQPATFSITALAGAAADIRIVGGDGQSGFVGQPLAQQLQVLVTDANTNPVSGARIAWSLSDAGGSLSADTTVTDGTGRTAVTYTLATTPLTELVDATLVTTGQTVTFLATGQAGPPAALVFGDQPSDATAGSVISPAVTVEIFDPFGNFVPTATSAVTISLGANPGGATLGGTLTASAVSGVAAFNDLTVSAAGVSYTLTANATGLTPDTSAAFTILAPIGLVRWAAAVSGNWSDPANWSPSRVPLPTDTVLVDLAGTYTVTLDVNDTVAALNLGGPSGTQTLAMSGRTLGASTSIAVAANGSLSAENATLNGPGVVTVAGGATLVVRRSTVNAAVVNQGVLLVEGNPNALGGALTQDGTLRVTNDQFGNGGIVTVASGFTNAGQIELTGVNPTTLAVTSGPLVNAVGATIVAEPTGGGSRTLAAALDNRGMVTVNQGLTLAQASAAHVNSGVVAVVAGDLTLTQTGTTPSFTNQSAGIITVGAAQTLAVTGGSFQNADGGALNGTGSVNFSSTAFTNLGTISPGLSPGVLTLTGAAPFGSTGRLAIELGGTTLGTEYDRLAVSGATTLDGTLDVTLLGGFTPSGGEQFTVLSFGSRTGDFTTVNLPALGGGLVWQRTFTATDMVLEVMAPPANLNRWSNAASGNWTDPANWSKGTAPVASDSVVIEVAGTYTVTLDVNDTVAYVALGGSSGTQTLAMNGRTLGISAAATVLANGVLTPTSSTINGPGTLTIEAGGSVQSRSSTLNAALENRGNVVLTGANTWNGVVTTVAGSAIQLQGDNVSGNVTLTVANGFANTAQVVLTNVDPSLPRTATLTSAGGILLNAVGGTVQVEAGTSGGTRTLNGVVINQGNLTVNHPLTWNHSGAAQNTGTITLNANLTLNHGGGASLVTTGAVTIGAGQTFAVSGGTLGYGAGTLGGTGRLSMSSATLALTPTLVVDTLGLRLSLATVNGPGQLEVEAGATLPHDRSVVNAGLVNRGTVALTGGNTWNGAVSTAAGSAIQVQGDNVVGNAALTVANGFTSNGQVVLTNVDPSIARTATLAVTSGVLVNSGTGTLQTVAGSAGGSRVLDAAVDNQGTFTVDHPLTWNSGVVGSLASTNSGALAVNQDLTVAQTAGESVTSTGAVTIAASRTLTASGGAFTNGVGGLLGGPGTLNVSAATFSNAGTVGPGLSAGILTVTGAYPQAATGSLAIELGGTTLGTQYDRLAVSGAATLDGTLDVTLISGFTPSLGDQFTVLTFGSRSGDFTTVNLPALGGGLDWQRTFNATDMVLEVVGPPVGSQIAWANTGGGNWSVPTNWTGGAVPGPLDTALITTAGTYTVTLDVSPSVRSVTLGGAAGVQTLDVPSAQTLTLAAGGAIVPSGVLHVRAGDLTVDGGSVLDLNGGSIRADSGRLLIVGTGDLTQLAYNGGSLLGDGGVALSGGAKLTLGATLSLDSAFVFLNDASVARTTNERLIIGPNALLGMISTSGASVDAIVENSGVVFARGPGNVFGDSLINLAGSGLDVDGDVGGTTLEVANGLLNHGNILLTNSAVGGAATLQVTTGNLLNDVDGTIASATGTGGGTRTLAAELDNRGLLTLQEPLSLDRSSSAHVNTGTIALVTGSLTVTQTGGNPTFANRDSIIVFSGQTLLVSGGTFVNDILPTEGVIAGDGTVNVSGTSFSNLGFIAPGLSPGLLIWAGNVPFGPNASLAIELGGTAVGTGYDQLNAAGFTVTLDGTLDVSLFGGFTPQAGDQFTVLRYGGRSGDFTTVNLPPLPGGLTWQRTLNLTDMVLEVLGPPAQILFAGDSAGGLSSGVFRVDGDGQNLKNVTPEGPFGDVHPRWSPDRTRITYSANPGGEPNQLHVASADGLEIAHLTSASDTSTRRARYSPDATHLAMECGDGGYPNTDQDVCVIGDVTGPILSLDGIGNDPGGKVYVTDAISVDIGGSGAFTWNPLNADELAVVRDSIIRGRRASQIWLVSFDGSGATPLTATALAFPNGDTLSVVSMDWSPDGAFIAFDAISQTGVQAIYRIELADGTVTQLTFPGGLGSDFRPVVSPDASDIVFGRTSDGFDIRRLPSGGGADVQMTPLLNFSAAQAGWDWSPDGTEIVHTTDKWSGGGIVIGKMKRGTTVASYAGDLILVGRAAQLGEVQDIQPSWRP